jgi:hypothetical protein
MGSDAGVFDSCEPYPKDSGVIDIRGFGALADDGMDDSQAINAALSTAGPIGATFFFPCGTFDLASSIRLPATPTATNVLQGGGANKTVLRFSSLPDAGTTAAILSDERNAARNCIRDLTVDVVGGNPNARGLVFSSAAQGLVRNVVARADGGWVGVLFGAGLVTMADVRVEGFRTGVQIDDRATLERVVVRGSTVAGVDVFSDTFARQVEVVSIGGASIRNGFQGALLLADSTLDGPAGAAILNNKAMFLRNVRASGGHASLLVSSLVRNDGRGNELFGLRASEFWANGRSVARRGGPAVGLKSAESMLTLPIEEAPTVDESSASTWVTPFQFGGQGNGLFDDTAAIQQAVNSAPVVFLPTTGQPWRIAGTISLPPTFRRLIGAESALASTNAAGATIAVGPGGNSVAIERLQLNGVGVTHSGGRTVVLRHLTGLVQYEALSTMGPVGKVFFEDVSFNRIALSPDQAAWARHLLAFNSAEGGPAKVTNRGGRLFLFGYFTQGAGTTLRTEQQGLTEVLGASHEGNGGNDPRYLVLDGSMTVALPRGGAFSSFVEIREGQTLDGGFLFSEGTGTWTADALSLWSDNALWQQRQEIILDSENIAPGDLIGGWQRVPTFFPDGGVSVTGGPGGYLGTSFSYATGATPSSVRYTFTIPEAGMYQVAARWPGVLFTAAYSQNRGATNYNIGGAGALQANQSQLGGSWVQIGTMYPLTSGSFTLEVSPTAPSTTIIADAIRLKKVQ